MPIKSASEVVKSTQALNAKQRKEKRQHDIAVDAERTRLEFYEDLRDEVMSVVKNSHLTYEDIHGRCGPHPSTLTNWAEHKIHAPRLGKLQAVLRICGYDLGIIDGQRGVSKLAAE